MITSLEVGSWPIISWSAQNVQRIELIHLDSVSTHGLEHGESPCDGAHGRSCWGGITAVGMVGLSWEWAQIAPQVFALTDPMAIDSNLCLLASDGGRLSPMATALVLNRMVAALHWHAEAARAYRRQAARRLDAVQAMPPAQFAS